MTKASGLLCANVFKVESCTDAESFFGQLKLGQEAVLNCLLKESHSAAATVTAAFERLGTHQRRRRILEMLLWPALDKPAMPQTADGLPDFIWQFQIPVTVTLGRECLSRTNVVGSMGLDVDAIGAALVDSVAFKNLSMLACWPSLYRREDFYAYGPLQLTQLMVDMFRMQEVDPPQPLPVLLDPEIPHGRVVTFHLWIGARMPLGATELLSREPMEEHVRQTVAEHVRAFLAEQGMPVDEVGVQDPQYFVEGYLTSGPAWKSELCTTLNLARTEFEPGPVRLQRPAPGYFELLADDRSLLVQATVTAMPRSVLDADIASAVEASNLKLAGSFGPAIQVSGMMH